MARPVDVAVIGAGAAGLAAAVAAAERGSSVLALDGLAPGGSLLNLREIPEWPSFLPAETGVELAGRLTTALLDAGAELQLRSVDSVELVDAGLVVCMGGDRVAARAVVVATGCAHPRLGTGAGDSSTGRGVSHCATCDGPLYAGRDVVVVGDDEWAVCEALVLSELAKTVTLVVPAAAPVARAGQLARLEDRGNVRLLAGSRAEHVRRTDAGLELLLAGGATLAADGVFLAGEGAPSLPRLPAAVRRRADGTVATDADGAAAVRGVFAAGSAATGARSIFETLAAAVHVGAAASAAA